MDYTVRTPSPTGSSATRASEERNRKDHCVRCALGSSRLEYNLKMEWFEDSAKEGCRACAGILKFLSSVHQNRINSFSYYRDNDLKQTLRAYLKSGSHVEYEFFVDKDEVTGRKQDSWGSTGLFISEMRKASGDTSSTAAFATLARWISRCQAEHPLCKSAFETSVPHRVLEIHSLRPLHVRVVENCLLRARYVCLSHRWGPETKAKSLVTHNLDLYKRGVSEDNFYPLIKNAIETAFRLGFRYIWIDSYCILQDKPSDWENEAANMASIYENAVLTISATSSEGGSNMFSAAAPESFGTKVTEVNGQPVFIRRQLEHPCDLKGRGFQREHLSGVTLDRAWIFQERLLSKRFIHFTREEIFWECQQSTWCECESGSLLWARRRKDVPRSLQDQAWDDIAREYNKTKLSYDTDRLPALAGVARRYGELHEKTYLAGLWKEDLPSALLWFKNFEHRPEPRPLHHVAPTWSWISLPRSQEVRQHNSPVKAIQIVGFDSKPPGSDIYTGGKHTEITVEGPVLDMTIYIQQDVPGDLIGKVDNAFLSLYADFDMDPEDPARHHSVLDGTSCVLLLCTDDQWQSSKSLVFGILLLPRSEFDSQVMKFERVGYLLGHCLTVSHLDESGEFTSFCGGSFPPFKRGICRSRVSTAWLMQRAEKRQITLI